MKANISRIVGTVLGLALLSGLVVYQAGAQEANPGAPLVILTDGTLWQWSGDLAEEPQRFSACQPDGEPVMSVPVFSADSRHIAFSTQPQMVSEAAARVGYLGDGPRPSNIWLCAVRLANGRLTLVGGQPDERSYFVDGVENRFSTASNPVWSPDGDRLAWTELRQPDSVHWLTIYDLASSSSQSIELEAEFQTQGTVPLDILWGTTGIYLREFAVPEFVIVYRGDGAFVGTLPIPHPADPKDLITRTLIIADESEEHIGLHWHYSGWAVLDLESGDMQRMADLGAWPERYHPGNPDGISLLLVSSGNEFVWWVATPESLYLSESGHTRAFRQFYRYGIALSSAGEIAEMADSIVLWRDGMESTLEVDSTVTSSSPSGVSWGPLAWRVSDAARRRLLPGATCPNLLVSRLAVGAVARVLPGEPNNLRAQSSPDADRVAVIPSGGIVLVMDGPRCAYGLAWWKVGYDGLVGWTAEGQGDHYWLEPMP